MQKEVSMHRQSGFTLIEVMITVAIIAILAGIAIPSYTSYIARSKIQEATSNLLAMRVKMEQWFQDNRAYPTTCGTATTATQLAVPTLPHFTITCPTLNPTQYTIRAEGGVDAGGAVIDRTLVGLRLEINEANQRWTRTAPADWGPTVAASLPKQCWVSKTTGDC
jgi:type IV pilus assembly protein PilE